MAAAEPPPSMPGPELLLPAWVRDYGPCSEAEELVGRGRVLPVAARQECARAQQWSSQPCSTFARKAGSQLLLQQCLPGTKGSRSVMGRGRGIKLQKKLQSWYQRSHLSGETELTPQKFQLGSQEESQHPLDCHNRVTASLRVCPEMFSQCFQPKADTAGEQDTQRSGVL